MKKPNQTAKLKGLLILPIFLAALIISQTSLVYAGGITVTTTSDTDTTDGNCSLREAIIAANTNVAYNDCTISGAPGADTIDLTTLSGTLTLTSNLPSISQTVQFNGPPTATLTVDGGNTYNAFDSIGNGVDIGVDYLSVTNVSGSGIAATNNLTVTNSTIAGSDCGVETPGGSAFVSNSQITGNNCHGVAVEDTATITGSTISGALDGVFAISGHITVTNSTVVGADYGVKADGGSAFVSGSVITGTAADGVYANNEAVVQYSTIKAGLDGVYVDNGKAEVTGSTITAVEDGVDVLSDAIVTGSTIEADVDGAYAFEGNIQITGSVITASNNGVYADGIGNIEVVSSTITSLTDDGIDADIGDVKVSNSVIFANESGVDTDTGDVEVTNSRVIGNEDGINAVGNATVISSTVTGNTLAGIQSSATATVSYSAIIDSGGDGVNALTANIFQSTISGNGGDGVQSSNQTIVNVDYSTIVGNSGYGLNNSSGTSVVSHTIMAQNGGVASTRDVNATLSGDSSYNLLGNGDGAGLTDGVNGNLVGSTGALLDPDLGLLADNGGPATGSGEAPKTHALLPGSPALDAIPGSDCTVTTDQRGEPRPYNSHCDIGAYEAQSSVLYLPLVTKQ